MNNEAKYKCPDCDSVNIVPDPNRIGLECLECGYRWQLEIDDIIKPSNEARTPGPSKEALEKEFEYTFDLLPPNKTMFHLALENHQRQKIYDYWLKSRQACNAHDALVAENEKTKRELNKALDLAIAEAETMNFLIKQKGTLVAENERLKEVHGLFDENKLATDVVNLVKQKTALVRALKEFLDEAQSHGEDPDLFTIWFNEDVEKLRSALRQAGETVEGT